MPYEYHPAALASDTTDYQASTLSRINMAITRGVPGAAISGAMSIYNTFLDYAGQDVVPMETAMRKFGGDSMGDYYQEHKSAIDITGLIGTSILPGGLGIKSLQLARGGMVAGNVGKYLNLASSMKKIQLAKALEETAQAGGTMKSILSASRLKYLGWEMADQAMLGTAAEIAIAATMHDSPVFDGDTLGDFAWNIGIGAGLSGGIGGLLGSIAAKGILRGAQKEIQAAARINDAISDTQKLGLTRGTDALTMAESILDLPTQFKNVDFQYTLDGKKIATQLPTEDAFARIRTEAEKLGQDKLAMKFNAIALGDERVGQAYFDFFQRAVASSKAAGMQPSEIVQKLHGYLANLDNIKSLDLEQLALDKRKFYIALTPAGETPAEKLGGLFSKTRTRNTSKLPFRLADDVTEADIVLTRLDDLPEVTLKDAFKRNPEIDVIQLPDGTVRVNPKSSRVLRVRENPVQVSQLIDLETGSLTDETAAVIGDILQKGKLSAQHDALYVNGRKYPMPKSLAASLETSPLEASARWAWISQMDANAFKRAIGDSIEATDFPTVTRLAELQEAGKLTDMQVRAFNLADNGETISWDDLDSVRSLLDKKRSEWMESELVNWTEAMGSVPDTRIIAAHLNTEYSWVEGMIAHGFQPAPGIAKDMGRVMDTIDSLKPRTVQATWDFGVTPRMLPEEAFKMNMGPSHLVTQELTKEYQRVIRRQIGNNAALAVLGQDGAQFQQADDLLIMSTSTEGAGSTMFGAANAGYGERAKLWAQNTGRAVAQTAQRRMDATIQSLAPSIHALRESPQAAGELGIVTTLLRRSQRQYSFHPEDSTKLVSQEVIASARAEKTSVAEALANMFDDVPGSPHSIDIKENAVIDFLRESTAINHIRQGKFTALQNAAGLTRKLPEQPIVYAPPINTVKYPYHAFVKTKSKLGLGSDVGMITAKSEEQLRTLSSSLSDDFDVHFKQDTENYFKIKGEYDYQMTLHEGAVNSELARRGKLTDAFPETRFENVNEDWLTWHSRQEERLVRDAVQVQSREFFSELNVLSDQYRRVSESVTRGIGSRFKSKVADPFGDYIKTALNVSKQQEFPLLDSLNDFVDKAGVALGDVIQKGFGDAQKGLISWDDANRLMESKGMKGMYTNIDQYLSANEKMPKNVIRGFFQKANMVLATTMLRLDFANSLINIISTPILLGTEMSSIKGMMKAGSPEAGMLKELTTVLMPDGSGIRVPSTTKLIANAVNNFFTEEGKTVLTPRYKAMGAMKNIADQYHQMLNLVSHDPKINMSEFGKRVDKGVEIAAKITGNTFAEDFTRFISADVMRQLSDPLIKVGKLTAKEQDAYISTFVNRVQGNYVTSQRPIVFQGTTGAAVSLFQTYAFNVLQQLHRHMERGDKRTLAVFAGLQGGLFGLNGLPFFEAVNTHLIGGMVSNNPEHKDAYSTLPGFNKDLGDWMLYGTASAFPLFSGSAPAFFSRGDINPRHALILPTAIVDVPVVSASMKLVKNIYDMGKNIAGGADMSDALLQGLEHQGWNRPLAGFAQLLAGQATDNKGALVSAANEFQATSRLGALADRTFSIDGVARLMGARPMDEAVALNAMYRNKSYEAMDRARIERLGEVVKTKLYNNQLPEQGELDDFMLRYTRSGGRIENFAQAMQRWSRDSNVSIVNQLADRMGNPYSRKLQTLMGGEALPDYRNQSADILAGQ